MQIYAHRGASADAPENTLEAFREAVRQASDGVELDVQLCASGEVIVCHDERLTRLAGRTWDVLHTPWWKLQRADVGSRLGFAPARIPLLEEVFDLLPKDVSVNVELKCETLDDHGLTARTLGVIRNARAEDRVIVSSFNPLCLWRLMRLGAELRRAYLIDPDRSFLLYGRMVTPLVSSHAVHPYFGQVTRARVDAWKASGLRVGVWTVDDPTEARRLQSIGVDYLITNRPRQLRDALATH